MAVIWRKVVDGRDYEVRTAGATLRLYRAGVLHSQYNRYHPITGRVWDLLWLPAFFPGPDRVRRVLVLGVGGGGVIRQIQHYLAPVAMTGVDLDSVHLDVARDIFRVGDGVELVVGEAGRWLQDYTGPGFDMIIEDLFSESEGLPRRGIPASSAWFRRLYSRLRAGGVLVMNFPDSRSLLDCAYLSDKCVSARFGSAFVLVTRFNANAVGVFCRERYRARALRASLRQSPELNRALDQDRLRYQIRQLSVS